MDRNRHGVLIGLQEEDKTIDHLVWTLRSDQIESKSVQDHDDSSVVFHHRHHQSINQPQ